MGVWRSASDSLYAAKCARPGCYTIGIEAASARLAKIYALGGGWVEVDGKLYCSRAHAAECERALAAAPEGKGVERG